MALLSVQNITRTGLTPTYATVTGSDTFVPDANTFLHVKNTNASPDTCVIAVLAGDPPGLTISDISITVPATTGDKMIGPLPANFFADPVTGLATATHTITTTNTSGVFKLNQP